jgi:hypothetical protein
MTAASKRDARSRVALAAVVIATAALAACTAGASVATSTPASAAPIETPGPSATAPSDSGAPSDDHGPGGSGALVVPRPGQLEVHPVAADSFSARVDGRHVVLTITYTSGVEPCSILDTIIVQRGEGSFAITLREGHGPGNQVCIMIARVMKTQVDLGELNPGSYTITDATGGADPIQVIVS